MSSWPPHLPIAMTASRTDAGLLPHLRPGHRQPGLERAAPPGRRARRRRRRRRRGGPGRARPAAPAAGGRPRASRRGPRSSGRAATGTSASGSAPTAVSSAARTAYAAGRVLPRVGSVRSRQWSGWRTRWSVSAWLAPSTRQQPHRGALVVDEGVEQASPGVVGRLGQPEQPGQREVGVGRAAEQGDERLGVVAEQGHPVEGAVGVDEPVPEQVAATRARPWSWHHRVIGGGPRPRRSGRRAAATRPRARRARRRSRRGRRRGRGPGPGASSRSSAAQGRRMSASTSGWCWTPHTVGANRAACTSTPRARGQHARPRRGASVTTSSCQCTPRRGVATVDISGSRWASGVQPSVQQPELSGRAGCVSTVPPRATAASWWPRQMPSTGTPSAACSRIRCFVGPSQGVSASSLAPIAPPSTTRRVVRRGVGQRLAGVGVAHGDGRRPRR